MRDTITIQEELQAQKKLLQELYIDMEQEAEPEGGPIADQYADHIMVCEEKIQKLSKELKAQEG